MVNTRKPRGAAPKRRSKSTTASAHVEARVDAEIDATMQHDIPPLQVLTEPISTARDGSVSQPTTEIVALHCNGLVLFEHVKTLAERVELRTARDGFSQTYLKRFDTRGVRALQDWGIERRENVHYSGWLDAVKNQAAAVVAKQLCEAIDHRGSIEDGSRHGIWRVTAQRINYVREAPKPGQVALVLIHGIFSTSAVAFNDFLQRPEQLKRWLAHYQQHIYCFDHPTLGKDPLENASDLLDTLEVGQEIHLLTHSRGGVIAELLSRSGVHDEACYNELARMFSASGRAVAERLERFDAKLREKRIKVSKLIRVAAPIQGSWLASDRLLDWLNGAFNLVRALVARSPILGLLLDNLRDAALAVAQCGLNPDQIPGVASMRPGNPLLAALRLGKVDVNQKLIVIAGDSMAQGIFGRIRQLFTDGFYGEDHDLVVPTRSMFGGSKRTQAVHYYFAQSADVLHTRYFSHAPTLKKIDQALTSTSLSDWPIFDEQAVETFDPSAVLSPNRGLLSKPKLAPDAALVVVLPGIMGSTLGLGGDRIWVDFSSLCVGEFSALRLDPTRVSTDPVPADNSLSAITAGEPLDSPINYYGRFVEEVERRGMQALPLAYDWRRPMMQTAKHLLKKLTAAWRPGQRLYLVTHSMGGLVARMMFDQDRALLARFEADKANRWLMLGTPNQGSLTILPALLGADPNLGIINKIAPQSMRELLDVACTFPGVFELLPFDQDWSYERLRAILEQLSTIGKIALNEQVVNAAVTARNAIKNAEAVLPIDQISYVAGSADPSKTKTAAALIETATSTGARYTIEYKAGDGRVSEQASAVAGLTMRFVKISHGDLLRVRAAFDGYFDLLGSGTTSNSFFSSTAPSYAKSRDLADRQTPLPLTPLYAPSREQVIAAIMGSEWRAERPMLRPQNELSISVTHGNLAFAKYPLLLGHYQGAALRGAALALDRFYGNLLERNIRLGTFPGPVESYAVFGGEYPHFPAGSGERDYSSAVIVGLGRYGELSSGQLRRTIKRGVLAWYGDDGPPDTTAGFSAVLMGSNVGGLTVGESSRAIVQGVLDACRVLNGLGIAAPNALELIELYDDRAHELQRELMKLEHDQAISARLRVTTQIETGCDGQERIGGDAGPTQSSRLQIRVLPSKRIRFTLPGIQAAVPTYSRFVDWREVSQYTSASKRDDGQAGALLFAQLLPRSLKRHALDQYNLVLDLDRRAAALPWELATLPGNSDEPPLAVTSAMIRQLNVAFAPIERVSERTALVIGDTQSGLPPLFGAQREGRMVTQCLDGLGFDVQTLEKADIAEVRVALGLTSYRIVHIAAHGVADYVPPSTCDEEPRRAAFARSGIVLGALQLAKHEAKACASEKPHLILLTPQDIVESLPSAPELVFLNCCHVGAYSDGRPSAERAANLADAFIQLGCRAVIATGWAVDDEAACAFARAFYESFAGGEPFNEAVRRARQRAYAYGGTTWGAYQCYGDPQFRTETAYNSESTTLPVSTRHAALLIRNIAKLAKGKTAGQAQHLLPQLLTIDDAALTRFWRAPANQVSFGTDRTQYENDVVETLVELGEYQLAIERASDLIQYAAYGQDKLRRWLPLLQLRQAAKIWRGTGAIQTWTTITIKPEKPDRLSLSAWHNHASIWRREFLRLGHVSPTRKALDGALVQHLQAIRKTWECLTATTDFSSSRIEKIDDIETVSKAALAAWIALHLRQRKALPVTLDPLADAQAELLQRYLQLSESARQRRSFWDDLNLGERIVVNLLTSVDRERTLRHWVSTFEPKAPLQDAEQLIKNRARERRAQIEVAVAHFESACYLSGTPKEREILLHFAEFASALARHFDLDDILAEDLAFLVQAMQKLA